MALTQGSLSAKLQAELTILLDIVNADTLEIFCDAVSKAVVDEIQANAQATGTTAVTSGSSAGSYITTIPPGSIT